MHYIQKSVFKFGYGISIRGRLRVLLGNVLKVCIDELVDVTVHYRIDVSVLIAGSRILNERVGHEHVVSDLAAPLDVRLVTLNVLDPVELLAKLDLKELCLKHFDRRLLVLELASLGLTSDNDSRGLMHDTDRGVGLVDVLSARTA